MLQKAGIVREEFSKFTNQGRARGGINNAEGEGGKAVNGGSNSGVCSKFSSPEGCRFGSLCRFRHDGGPVSGSVARQPTRTTTAPPSGQHHSAQSTAGGAYQREASGSGFISDPRARSKKPCTFFFGPSGYCRKGDKCDFTH
jgi:hypothetical protein